MLDTPYETLHIYLGMLLLAPVKQYFPISKRMDGCVFISNITEKNESTDFHKLI